jgi:hypothetical protein
MINNTTHSKREMIVAVILLLKDKPMLPEVKNLLIKNLQIVYNIKGEDCDDNPVFTLMELIDMAIELCWYNEEQIYLAGEKTDEDYDAMKWNAKVGRILEDLKKRNPNLT